MMLFPLLCVCALTLSCGPGRTGLLPIHVSDPVLYDSDDPAIWINQASVEDSLIIGTDKGSAGSLYVFDYAGNTVKTIRGLSSPNNVDVEYGVRIGGRFLDIAVVTERGRNRLRVYAMPEMTAIDGGGIPVFEGESNRECMGIALYKRSSDGEVYAIVSRKNGPSGSYLRQYHLEDRGDGVIVGSLSRSFGAFSGLKEIESIAVDDELGYVYYSDETAGIRKYHADPDHPEANIELAFFGRSDFRRDMEGISVYDAGDGTGYLIVSDQQANRFNIYSREGDEKGPHSHTLIKSVETRAELSDGNEVASSLFLDKYPGGLFVAMSDDRTFHFYSWKQFAEAPGEVLKTRSHR